MNHDSFSDISDATLMSLIGSKLSDPTVIEALTHEAIVRGLFRGDDLEPLLKRYVEAGLSDLLSRYNELDEVTWGSDWTDVQKDFAKYAEDWLGNLGSSPPEEPDWPWPISEPPDGPPGKSGPEFEHTYSGLRLCGYHVGKTKGMPVKQRRDLLSMFFRNQLPSVVAKYHGDEYGEPGSEKRLRKMANVIASHCRNFKKNDREKFRFAIADWESDLSFLRESYYIADSFPWPEVEVEPARD